MANSMSQVGNSMVGMLLRSPLHGLMSKDFLLITVTGRKSGKEYTTPVNYQQDENMVWITSQRERTWWRNLRGGAAVKLLIRGKYRTGWGTATYEHDELVKGLQHYLELAPQQARFFNVGLDEQGHPVETDVEQNAAGRVIVVVKLDY